MVDRLDETANTSEMVETEKPVSSEEEAVVATEEAMTVNENVVKVSEELEDIEGAQEQTTEHIAEAVVKAPVEAKDVKKILTSPYSQETISYEEFKDYIELKPETFWDVADNLEGNRSFDALNPDQKISLLKNAVDKSLIDFIDMDEGGQIEDESWYAEIKNYAEGKDNYSKTLDEYEASEEKFVPIKEESEESETVLSDIDAIKVESDPEKQHDLIMAAIGKDERIIWDNTKYFAELPQIQTYLNAATEKGTASFWYNIPTFYSKLDESFVKDVIKKDPQKFIVVGREYLHKTVDKKKFDEYDVYAYDAYSLAA